MLLGSLIDLLNRCGFCCSYKEVKKFEHNAALEHGIDICNIEQSQPFIQYVADNVDHNLRTLDGKGTFHGMGIIATITPAAKFNLSIPRKKIATNASQELARVGKIKIYFHKEERSGLTALQYQQLVEIKATNHHANIDTLWKVATLFKSPKPLWSGLMQSVHHGSHPGKSSVMFLPMIDMDPTDVSCIYSTLKFVCHHAHRHNVQPIITFDQPLWWKALMIIVSEPADSDVAKIVLRLGGFHTQMSFLGCIGHLMAGSGLLQILENIYASNVVEHILSGKATARAVRAHFLVDAALNAIITAKVFNVELNNLLSPCTDNDCSTAIDDVTAHTIDGRESDAAQNSDLDTMTCMLDQLMLDEISLETVAESQSLTKVRELTENMKNSLKCSRTASLWLQYMDMIDILRKFLRAERLGDWQLHLQAVSEMLPFMAAAGHNLYTKSLRLYIQRMIDLESSHPEIYQSFQSGLHVVRRSDRLWAGLSTDLVIEQVLMRSMKSRGGLTRGRGMTETQRTNWLLSMPSCAVVNRAMEEITGFDEKIEQNKDLGNARQVRDTADIRKVIDFLEQRNPFHSDTSLRNIATGVHAHRSVDVDRAVTVGNTILAGMTGYTPAEYVFKKTNQAITLAVKTSVKIDNEVVQIDPQLLFQRLIIAAKEKEKLQAAFKYELCSFPASLFESAMVLREPQKPLFADALWAMLPSGLAGPSGTVKYILDGGALLQRIPWSGGLNTYEDICTVYTDYVERKYGANVATVVFDGYNGSSTKDMTHKRRTTGNVGATVDFSADMKITMKREIFLANSTNKQRFINLLSDRLKSKGCETFHADGDADLLIVLTAVKSAETMNTVLVGDDTDLLVLLCYHGNLASHELFFKPEPKKDAKKVRVWNIKALKDILGPQTSKHLLFLHAVLGCDTTSRLYGVGKSVSLKKFLKNDDLKKVADVFHNENSSEEEVAEAGEHALVSFLQWQPRRKPG